jgi:hypothetical protein
MNVAESVNLSVGLAQTDPYDIPIELSVSDPAIASVSLSKVTIPAGQTSKSVAVKGLAYGATVLMAEAGGKKALATLKIEPPAGWLSTAVSVVLEDTGTTSQGVSVVLENAGTVGGPVSVILEDAQVYTPAWAAPVSVKIGP